MELFTHILVNDQHDFRRAKYTLTNTQIDAIYTELHTAFDKVDHCLHLTNLRKIGLRNPLLLWFSSYLNERS